MVLDSWKDFVISESMNMALKRSLTPRHDLREKWLETAYKLQTTSAFKVLAGINILSTVFDFEFNEGPCFCSDDCFWKKDLKPRIYLCFFASCMTVNPATPMLEISKSFLKKLQ